VVVPYSDFGRRADVDAMVDAALAVGRSGSMVERAIAEVRLAMDGESLPPRVILDAEALTERIQHGVHAFDREPVDSEIVKGIDSIYAMPGRSGRTFDGTAAASQAVAVVSQTDAPSEVTVEATEQEIPPAYGDAEANAAIASAQQMVGDLQVTFGDTKWTIRAARIRSWITFETDAAGATVPVLDESKIPPFLSNIAKTVKRAPVSASFLKTRGGRIVGVVAATNGRKLDTAATASAIAAAIKARGTGAAPAPVEVEVASVAPKFTTAQAVKRGPLMQALGTWKTWFPVGERNYFGANIWRPAEVIDGTVLMPGQRFEWWSALGTVSSATGYGPGGFIAGDHTDPTGALGGGMCSSSTTLFNAALRAGLQMGARANHKYYIDRYPLGLDATVSKTRNGSQTISFTNDTKGPIVIRTFRYRAGGRGWVRYEIWGVPDGRTVSLSRPSVANVRKASTTTRYVSTLPTGVREQIEYPANGMDVAVSRVVRDKRGRVIHSETYRTHYVLWNGIVNVGR
jgi:vancomycin resistance protein YoaR